MAAVVKNTANISDITKKALCRKKGEKITVIPKYT